MKHVINFSGGICSWAAAKRVAKQYGTENLILLFADTRAEDEDLYRFLTEAARNVGAPLTTIADGRTPWEAMRDERMIGNSKYDPCSRILKRSLMDKWREKHCDPNDTTVYVGLDWTEAHRLTKLRSVAHPWRYEAPMCEPPHLTKVEMMEWAESEGIRPPRLYDLGFNHNNCGGACIKAGQAQWALLWRTFPERYLKIEKWEEEMRACVGEHSILRDRSNGTSKPLTLRAFRARLEAQQSFDANDWGGCGCALPT